MKRKKKWKWLLVGAVLTFVVSYFVLTSFCGIAFGVKIDHGKSQLFTLEDRKSVERRISLCFVTFYGCRMTDLSYTSDKQSQQELTLQKKLDHERYQAGYDKKDESQTYDECMVYTSSFRTNASPAPGLNTNFTYHHWRWIFVRKAAGHWRLRSYGMG